MLELDGIDVYYDRVQVLHRLSLTVGEGEIVSLLGANGAGKTTTLKAISGLVPLAAGSVRLAGERIDGRPVEKVVSLGVAHVPEGRRVFPGMTVLENLRVVGYALGYGGRQIQSDVDRVLELFPPLRQRRNALAWSLSGGEQQMLAIGRGLMARPGLLLLDEPSLGLAPLLVEAVFQSIREIHRRGATILLVEQNARMALRMADRGYVLENGRVTLEGSSRHLLESEEVKAAYLGGR